MMEFSGEYKIDATRQTVWEALNDPDILKQAIPGCQTIERLSPTEMTATVKSKIGPVQATFKGKVTLSNLNPPDGYTITGEGQGGVAGFAKGGADVSLSDAEGGGTLLGYQATGQVGGKIAQVGARLVEGTGKKLADQFFGAFNDLVGALEPVEPEQPVDVPESSEPAPAQAPGSSDQKTRWIAAAVVVVAVVAILVVVFS